MTALPYSLQFRGHATRIEPGVLLARASAPSCAFVTTVDHGVRGRFESAPGGEALLEARVSFVGERAFELLGTIGFGNGSALRFRSLGAGVIAPSAEPGLRHGTAVCEVDGGSGSFEAATGRITSNFLISDTGELTEHQLGLLFIQRKEER
jgi:hypothetical protein